MTASPLISPELSDAIGRFSAGDMTSFDALYDHFGRDILAFIASRCRGRLDAEDLAQEVWVRVMNYQDGFNGGNFRAWLFQIARNYMIDCFRKKGEAQLADNFDQPAVTADLSQSEELNAMKHCLENLGGPFVSVLIAQLDGVSTQEIADRESIGVNTVYSRVSRAKDQVRECVETKLQ